MLYLLKGDYNPYAGPLFTPNPQRLGFGGVRLKSNSKNLESALPFCKIFSFSHMTTLHIFLCVLAMQDFLLVSSTERNSETETGCYYGIGD